MSARTIVERGLNYSPLVAAAVYATVVCLLLATTVYALVDIYSGASALADTSASSASATSLWP